MGSNDWIHKILNYVVVPIVYLSLLIVLPLLLVYRFIFFIINYFVPESVKGKVVLITGASAGIGESIAYVYAKRGASLVLVARREQRLKEVAERAKALGSPDVLSICADVSDVNACKDFVDKTIDHFGRLDHLVNNAGITSLCAIEDAADITKFKSIMDINFWGSVYPTYFAIPHLKKTKGKIVINSSVGGTMNPPRLGFYMATKAAQMSFYDALRMELAPSIKVIIVTLGLIKTEMTQGKHLSKEGVIETNLKMMEDYMWPMPMMDSDVCTKAVVDEVCRGVKYITEPKWFKTIKMLKQLCPELIDVYYHLLLLANPIIKEDVVAEFVSKSSPTKFD